jgi:virginiamycin B lyase
MTMRTAALFFVLPVISLAQHIAIGGYPVPTVGSGPEGITAGPDGALWFTESAANKIGRIATSGTITEYPVPTAASDPYGIAAGPDGALWFTEYIGNNIGRITTAGVITEYPVPTANSDPDGITAGPDGALWFTEYSGYNIGRITTTGSITEYPATVSASGPPFQITAGPDGALWFTEYQGHDIGRITTAGVITEFALHSGNTPYDITAGPDGALWFTEPDDNGIGRIATSGKNTHYALPTDLSFPSGITTGPDGALWFTELSGDKIGRITIAGAITEYHLPLLSIDPAFITVGADGELWFTEGTGLIGEVVFRTAGLSATPDTGAYQTGLTFAGSGFASGESVDVYYSGVGSGILATGIADASGSFTVDASEPQSPYGPRLFLGVGQSSGNLGAASFSVTPLVVLQPDSGKLLSTVSVEGYGFGALEQVRIQWGSPPTLLGTVTASVDGNVTMRFKVPVGAFAGPNTVHGVGKATRAQAKATFTVE